MKETKAQLTTTAGNMGDWFPVLSGVNLNAIAATTILFGEDQFTRAWREVKS